MNVILVIIIYSTFRTFSIPHMANALHAFLLLQIKKVKFLNSGLEMVEKGC